MRRYNTYLEYMNFIYEDNIIFIKGKISNQLDNNKITQIIANKIYSGNNIKDKITKKINIKIEYMKNNAELLNQLQALCKTYKGEYPIVFHMLSSQSRVQKIINKKSLVNNTTEFLQQLRSLFGATNVWIS